MPDIANIYYANAAQAVMKAVTGSDALKATTLCFIETTDGALFLGSSYMPDETDDTQRRQAAYQLAASMMAGPLPLRASGEIITASPIDRPADSAQFEAALQKALQSAAAAEPEVSADPAPADVSENQPETDTTAEPVQETAESEQVEPAAEPQPELVPDPVAAAPAEPEAAAPDAPAETTAEPDATTDAPAK
jgi:hypothetical protein